MAFFNEQRIVLVSYLKNPDLLSQSRNLLSQNSELLSQCLTTYVKVPIYMILQFSFIISKSRFFFNLKILNYYLKVLIYYLKIVIDLSIPTCYLNV